MIHVCCRKGASSSPKVRKWAKNPSTVLSLHEASREILTVLILSSVRYMTLGCFISGGRGNWCYILPWCGLPLTEVDIPFFNRSKPITRNSLGPAALQYVGHCNSYMSDWQLAAVCFQGNTIMKTPFRHQAENMQSGQSHYEVEHSAQPA